ncbi:MAG: hypothetical protein J6R29_05910 [Clostridia bacterium]|nr:hypothetical protein [Clostridia bacterium]
MKTNKDILKTLINGLIALVLLGLYIFAIVNAYGLFKGKLLLYVALLVAGAVVSLFLYSLIHELGHLTVGLFAGLKFSKICVLIFLLELENGKFKFKLVKPTEFGYTEMLPKTPYNYAEKLAISAVGGLVFSLISAFASMFICLSFTGNIFVFCLFGAPYPLALYIFLINALPFFKGSDGDLVFSVLLDEKTPSTLKNYYTALASVLLKKEPCEINRNLLEIVDDKPFSQPLKYLRYLSYLQTDFKKAYDEISALQKLDIIDDNLYFNVKKEVFFCKAVLHDDNYVNENASAIVGDIDLSDDLCNFRVHAVYRIFINDIDFAKLIIKNGIDTLSKKTQNGLVISEIKYLQALKEQLDAGNFN